MNWFTEQRIVVPYDFSDQSLAGVRFATRLGDGPSVIYVLHVMIDWYPTHPSVVMADYDEEKFKAETLDAIREKLRTANIDLKHIEISVAIGDPGTHIADYAEKVQAGLIVIPSHGRTGIKRILLGSVAERVVRLAKCPVLVLKDVTTP